MEKDSYKAINKKKGSLLELFKNAKFIALNVMALVMLGIALISGDGKKIALNFYENLTGEKLETFSSIEDFSHETYKILKYKLSHQNIGIKNADVTLFKESDALYKYRVVLKEDVIFYKVEKKLNGTWQIKQEK
jgi:hypothetical protein